MQYGKINKITRYIYDESGISGMAVYENGELSKIYRFEKNIFGDVIAIYDNNAVLQCTYKYDAFGYPRVYDGNGSILKDDTNIGASNPIRYRGYYYDTETGLYYLLSRYYDPRSKRFISPDDASYLDPANVGGMNPYAYCMNNPVMYADPSGHFAFLIALAGIAINALFNAIDGGITAAISGQDFWLGFAAGAIGGAVGGVINGAMSLIPGFGTWSSIIGRGASTAIYGLLNELFQNGSLDNMDWGIYGADIFMDMLFSMLYVESIGGLRDKVATKIGVKFASLIGTTFSTTVGSIIDGVVDVLQAISVFNYSVIRDINGNSNKNRQEALQFYEII